MSRGFTLVEVLVVVAVLGMLAAFGVPSYIASIENTKADLAKSAVEQLAAANRMKAASGGGYYTGAIDAATTQLADYMRVQDLDMSAYTYHGAQKGKTPCVVASAARIHGGKAGGTSRAPYKSWGFCADRNGTVAGFVDGACPLSCP